MSSRYVSCVIALAGLLGIASPVPADAQAKAEAVTPARRSDVAEDKAKENEKARVKDERGKPDADKPGTTTAPVVPVYRPPSRGAPQVRVGGGTRGLATGDARGLNVAVIAPDHTGLAATAQPDLFWFVSRPVASPVEFVLTDVDAVDPLVEKQLPPPSRAGIQRISLADLGATLLPGKEYQWSVSLVKDAKARSQDTMAAGKVKWVAPPAALQARVAGVPADRAYATFADAGYWYDAISRLRGRLAADPANAELIAVQASFLDQVGLVDVARFEREGQK